MKTAVTIASYVVSVDEVLSAKANSGADISKLLKWMDETDSRLVLHVAWIVRVKQCIGAVILFQRYRQLRVVTAKRRPIPLNTGIEGQLLAAVSARWHEQGGHYRTVDMLEAHCEHVSA